METTKTPLWLRVQVIKPRYYVAQMNKLYSKIGFSLVRDPSLRLRLPPKSQIRTKQLQIRHSQATHQLAAVGRLLLLKIYYQITHATLFERNYWALKAQVLRWQIPSKKRLLN